MMYPNFLLTPSKHHTKKIGAELEIALKALELYAFDINAPHNPQFARKALMDIYSVMLGKPFKDGESVTMPRYKCVHCKQEFVSLRKEPTCPFCSHKGKKK